MRVTPGTSNPGVATLTPGGVGRNIAENLARLGTRTSLVTVLGRDAAGDALLSAALAAGVGMDHVRRTDKATGTYTAVLDRDGELVVGVADMAAVDSLSPDDVDAAHQTLVAADLVVLDGNLAVATVQHICELAHAHGVRIIVDPVSVPKALRMAAHVGASRPVYLMTPNRDELAMLSGMPTGTDTELRTAAAALHRRGVDNVWVRLGERGSLFSAAAGECDLVPAVPIASAARVVDVTGAGDAMLAAYCHALLAGAGPIEAVKYGAAAASLTIASTHTVRPDLTPTLIKATLTATQEHAP